MATTTGWFADQQIKRRRREFVRKHWWRIGMVFLGVLAIVGGTAWIFPDVHVPLWMTVLLILGFGVGLTQDQLDGTYQLVAGRDAEGWSSKELRKATPPGSRVVDGILFEHHDIDHVVLSPQGVFVVETKYTDASLDLTRSKGRSWAGWWTSQARNNAESIRYFLLSERHRIQVIPLVVVWGSEVSNAPAVIDGVTVLKPIHLRDYFSTTRTEPLDPETMARMATALEDFRDKRLEYERNLGPSRCSLAVELSAL